MASRTRKIYSEATEAASHVDNAADNLAFIHTSFSRIFEQNSQIFEQMMRAAHEESLRFVNKRLERTSHALEDCRQVDGFPGLMRIQQEWLLKLAEDYFEETQRFGDILRDFATTATGNTIATATEPAPFRRRAEESAREAA